MRNLINFFSIAISVTFMFSCEKYHNNVEPINEDESTMQEDTTLTINGLDGCSEPDSVYQIIAYAFGNFFDEIAEDGLDSFNVRNDLLESYLEENFDDTVLVKDFINLYVRFHKMDSIIVANYFSVIVDYNSIISDPDSSCIIAALYDYTNEYQEYTNEYQEDRWLFSTLANIFDAGCTISVFAGIVDTALLAAGTVVAAPTGIGLAIGIVGVASSYANMLNTALTCEP